MTASSWLLPARPVASYLVLACGLSWGGVLLVIGGPGGLFVTADEAAPLIPSAILVMLVGPSVAAVVVTGFLHGRQGIRRLLARLLDWRAAPRWYAVAVLTAPLLATASLLMLLPVSPELVPGVVEHSDPVFLVVSAFVGSLLVGVFEELGWTGFALPELRRRHGILAAGLILGLLWGVWHSLLALWGTSTPAGTLSATLVLPELVFYFAVLPAYRVLMVWVHDRTRSLPVIVLMHASLTAAVPLALMPTAAAGRSLTAWYLVLTVMFWGVVVGIRRFAADGLLRPGGGAGRPHRGESTVGRADHDPRRLARAKEGRLMR